MSYQVLARKYRPRFFREMVGQEHVLRALINALDTGRLHHAYLFTGTRGVGKTTIARILAKCLNCEQQVTSEPCGECDACMEIGQGRFVDLIEVDAASRTRVDETRELLDNVQYAPSKGRFKIYLIDEVHMLSMGSFNALLKTLEEPPEHVKFLLATTDPQKLPATVLSRCLQFNLKNMPPAFIVSHLAELLKLENLQAEEQALWSLAHAANGSMRDALSLTDQAIAFCEGKIQSDSVNQMLGAIDQNTTQRLVSALIHHRADEVLAIISDISDYSPDFAKVLDDVLFLLHRVTLGQAVPEALDNSLGDLAEVSNMAGSITAEELQLFYQMGLLGKKDLPLAPDPRVGLEMALLRMLTFRPQGTKEPASLKPSEPAPEPSRPRNDALAGSDEQVSEAPSGQSAHDHQVPAAPTGRTSTSVTPVNDEQPEPETAPPEKAMPSETDILQESANAEPSASREKSSPSVSLTNPQWLELFDQLPFTGLLKSIAAQLVVQRVQHAEWTMLLDKDKAQLYNARHAEEIAAVLQAHYHAPVALEIVFDTHDLETPEQFGQRRLQEGKARAREEILGDAGVQGIMTTYAATLDEDSVVLVQS